MVNYRLISLALTMPVPATVTATIPFILKTLTGVVLVAHADVTLL
ncbi:hypothetical protein A4157S3_1450007 [Escherichia coli]|nr:Uncharacterised protein [Escherichia coli]SCA71379.1 hypothetical protein NCTC86EC_01925 [Escherichia coli]SOQ61177.1 hypothetical protein A4157S2_1660005 [Escherichia coli]SOQ69079.1 hypothetical protein A4157S1_730021 [Escherichia coli]SOQ71485.1 hypothetical protein A4157S3_1450007 [Escherichia coli]